MNILSMLYVLGKGNTLLFVFLPQQIEEGTSLHSPLPRECWKEHILLFSLSTLTHSSQVGRSDYSGEAQHWALFC